MIVHPSLRVGYLNVQGLTLSKFHTLSSLIPSQFDILFAAETWFLHYDTLLAHPLSFLSTPRPPPTSGPGHYHHGMMCLISPSIRHLVSSSSCSDFVLEVRFPNVSLAAVYLPPSLPPSSISSILEAIPRTTTVLGDFNARYGPSFGDTTSGPQPRLDAIASWRARNHLQHPPPITGITRTEHIFTPAGDTTTWMAIPPPVSTDHPCLMSYTCNFDHNPAPAPSLTRYYLRDLGELPVQKLLCEAYDYNALAISDLFHQFSHSLPRLLPKDRQAFLDSLDGILTDTCQTASETVLGSYSVVQAKTRADTMHAALANSLSPSDAIRLFRRAHRGKHGGCTIQSSDNSSTPMEESIRHFQKVYTQPDEHLRLPETPSYAFHAVGNRELTSLFSTERISNWLNRYPTTKSCGVDSLHGRILQVLLSSSFPSHLSLLFELCALTGLTPARWNRSLVCPIPKTTNAKIIADFRPISLTVMFRRCFEGLLLRWLSSDPATEALRSFNFGQAGFRRGFSTCTHAATAHDQHGPSTHHAFIDLRQAYDRVPLPLLLGKLEQRGADPTLLSLTLSLFGSTRLSILVNGIPSPDIQCQRGLMQGSLLSPFLFNVFIDDLAEKLNTDSLPSNPACFLFADDIKLGTPSLPTLSSLLECAWDWMQVNGMEPNHSKSGYIGPSPDPPLLGNITLPHTPEYRYLGFPFTASGIAFGRLCDHRTITLRNLLRFLEDVGTLWPIWIRLIVYRTFVRPALEYGAPLLYAWTLADRQRLPSLLLLDAAQDDALRWVARAPRRPTLLHSLLGIPPITTRFEMLAASFVVHLNRMSADNPAAAFLSSHGIPPWPSHLLLPRCRANPLYRMFLRSGQERLSGFLRSWLQEHLTGSGLAAIILPSARTRTGGPDAGIFLPEHLLRDNIVKWRLGTYGFHSSCVCTDFFFRSHLSCFPDLPAPPEAFLQLETDRFTHRLPSNVHYTILDSVLNHRNWPVARAIFSFLTERLQLARKA